MYSRPTGETWQRIYSGTNQEISNLYSGKLRKHMMVNISLLKAALQEEGGSGQRTEDKKFSAFCNRWQTDWERTKKNIMSFLRMSGNREDVKKFLEKEGDSAQNIQPHTDQDGDENDEKNSGGEVSDDETDDENDDEFGDDLDDESDDEFDDESEDEFEDENDDETDDQRESMEVCDAQSDDEEINNEWNTINDNSEFEEVVYADFEKNDGKEWEILKLSVPGALKMKLKRCK